VAAERAGAAGLKVVLFERKSLGGVCLNEGCIPTKTLLYSAKVYNYAKTGDHYGVYVSDPSFKYDEIVARKNKVVKKLVGGVKAAMKGNKVEVVAENATIKGRDSEGIKIEAGGNAYAAKNLLICTGSEAAVPPFPGLKEAGDVIVTNREILDLTERPEALVVIGGGVIGMEFAAFFSTLGTKVTVVEMLPKILGPLDDEISEMLQKQYEKRGVEFCLRCKVTGIEGNTVVYEDPEGKVCRVSGDKILVSVGRRANLQGFGLEIIGVELALNPAGRP
jgi:dihydrolipoamide dehydrogenase